MLSWFKIRFRLKRFYRFYEGGKLSNAHSKEFITYFSLRFDGHWFFLEILKIVKSFGVKFILFEMLVEIVNEYSL